MNDSPFTPRDRLIFALDVPNGDEAFKWVDRFGDSINFYKIGMELLASGDYFAVLDALATRGKRIFVDLKFFDIPATVASTIARLSEWPVTLCTLHGWHPAMLEAAVNANSGPMRLLAVTVLTSMQQADLAQMGVTRSVAQVVVDRAQAARKARMDGVIASCQDAAQIRKAVGQPFLIVCPGIRADTASPDDQQRPAGVTQAFLNGADAIVVGRPLRAAAQPRAHAEALQQEIAQVVERMA